MITYSLQALTDIANILADLSEPIIHETFRTGLEIMDKEDESPVTIADRNVEKAMRHYLNQHHPDQGIFGEEFGVEGLDKDWVWVLDPIDGTAAFSTGMPVFGTLIAAATGGRPEIGVINQPMTKERWVGIRGEQTLLNGAPVKTRDVGSLTQAALYATTPDMFNDEEWQAFERVRRSVRSRRFGGDCYAYGLLAAGHIDLVIESGLKPYDFMALVPVVEGAGGIMTDWQGNELTLQSGPQVIAAATKALHQDAIERLNP